MPCNSSTGSHSGNHQEKDKHDTKLSKEEVKRVADLASKRRIKDIEIEDAPLLFESVVKTIYGLLPGGHDLSRVLIIDYAYAFVRYILGLLCQASSGRSILEFALEKLLSMRVTINDTFILSHFGYLVSRKNS